MLLLALPLTTLLIWVVIACIVFAVLYWIVNQLIPEPFRRWIIIALVVIGAIVLIKILLQFAGGEPTL